MVLNAYRFLRGLVVAALVGLALIDLRSATADVVVDPGQTLVYSGDNTVSEPIINHGTIQVNQGARLNITGSYTGAGGFNLPDSTIASSASLATLMTRGLQFSNSQSNLIAGPILPANTDHVIGAHGTGTVVTINGAWDNTGSGNPFIAVSGGGKVVFGPDAFLKHQLDTINARSMLAKGDGNPNSILELDVNFVADGSTTPLPNDPPPFPAPGVANPNYGSGWSGFNMGGLTLVSHHTQSLPSIWKGHSYGGTNHHGLLNINSAPATWRVKTNPQTFDGQMSVTFDATFDLHTDLNYTGNMLDKSETSLRVNQSTSTSDSAPQIIKTGPGNFNIWGDQGYGIRNGQRPTMISRQGTINLLSDPGAGYHSFNQTGGYTRDAAGNINSITYSPNLQVQADGNAALVNFGAALSGIHSLESRNGGTLQVATFNGGHAGPKTVNTKVLTATTSSVGTLNVEAQSVVNVSGAGATLAIATGSTLHVNGLGELNIAAGTTQSYGTNATMNLSSGVLRFNTTGTSSNRLSLNIQSDATLLGLGSAFANVTNAGLVAPGNSAGTLSIDGTYAQSSAGSLEIEIGGSALASYDRLSITGSAALSGMLDLSLINNFTPNSSHSFTILTASSISGQFANAPAGMIQFGTSAFDIHYNANSVVLDNFQTVPIPEPSSVILLGVALLIAAKPLTLLARRRTG